MRLRFSVLLGRLLPVICCRSWRLAVSAAFLFDGFLSL